MHRKDFLFTVGKGVLIACSGSCLLAACSSGDDGTTEDAGVPGATADVTINLADIPNIGDQKTVNGVLFIRTAAENITSSFVAIEAVCPHQQSRLLYQSNGNLVECQLHFARFQLNGDTIRGPQNSSGSVRDLKVFTTTLSETTLTAAKV